MYMNESVIGDSKLERKANFRPSSNRVSLYFTNQRQVMVQEEELPRMGDNQVLVETLLSAISPGTESLIYRGEFPGNISVDENIVSLSKDFSYPIKYGYSAAGRVIDIGKDVDSQWKDRLVMAFNPHESHFIADPKTLMLFPEDIKPDDGVFLPNMETAINFLMDGKPLIGEDVAVFGQGIVGLLTTGLLARIPLASLIALDRFPMRRQVSREVGARVCLDPEDADLQERLAEFLPNGADLTYEVSGSPAALDQALAATGFAGRIVIGSWYGSQRSSLSLGGQFHRSRIRLISSQVSTLASEFQGRWTKARRLGVAWEMIRQLKPSRFVTHRFPIQEAAKAYNILDQEAGSAIQILLTYQ
jgi:2-desacetyl-2-hydroxyethyl bacteriochlorophyllide A dehydrogenase